MANVSFPGKIIINVNAQNFVLVVKGIILPSITIKFSSTLTRFCLVWNSIATVLFTFMRNLLDLNHSIILGISILIVFIMAFVSVFS